MSMPVQVYLVCVCREGGLGERGGCVAWLIAWPPRGPWLPEVVREKRESETWNMERELRACRGPGRRTWRRCGCTPCVWSRKCFVMVAWRADERRVACRIVWDVQQLCI